MPEWLIQYLETAVMVMLAIASGFFSFIILVVLKILKHGERLKAIETKYDETVKPAVEDLRKLSNKVEQIQQESLSLLEEYEALSLSYKYVTLVQELCTIIEYLGIHDAEAGSDVKGYDKKKEQQFERELPIPKVPKVCKSKSKVRPNRVRIR